MGHNTAMALAEVQKVAGSANLARNVLVLLVLVGAGALAYSRMPKDGGAGDDPSAYAHPPKGIELEDGRSESNDDPRRFNVEKPHNVVRLERARTGLTGGEEVVTSIAELFGVNTEYDGDPESLASLLPKFEDPGQGAYEVATTNDSSSSGTTTSPDTTSSKMNTGSAKGMLAEIKQLKKGASEVPSDIRSGYLGAVELYEEGRLLFDQFFNDSDMRTMENLKEIKRLLKAARDATAPLREKYEHNEQVSKLRGLIQTSLGDANRTTALK